MFGYFCNPFGGTEKDPPKPLEPSSKNDAADATKVQNALPGIGNEIDDVNTSPVYGFVPSSVLDLKPTSAAAQSCDVQNNVDAPVLTTRANGKTTTLTAKGSRPQMPISKEKSTPITPIASKVPSDVIEVRLRQGKSQIDRLVSATPESGISAEATGKEGPRETIEKRLDRNPKEAKPKVNDMSMSPKDDVSSEESSQGEKSCDFLEFEVPCEEEYTYNVNSSELVSEKTFFEGAPRNRSVIAPDMKVADSKAGDKESVDNSDSTEAALSIFPGNLCDIAPDMKAGKFKASGDESVNSGAFKQASGSISLQPSGSANTTHGKTCLRQQASEEKSSFENPSFLGKKCPDEEGSPPGCGPELAETHLTATALDTKSESILLGTATESFDSEEDANGEVLSKKTGAPLRFARIFDGAPNQLTSEASSNSNLTSLDVRPNSFTMTGYETQTSTPPSSQCAISPGSDGVTVSSQNSHYAVPGNKEAYNQLQSTQFESSPNQPSTNQANLGICDIANGDNNEREVHEDMEKIPSVAENLTRLKLDKSPSQNESDESRFKRGASISIQRMDSNMSSASKGSHGSKRGVELPDCDEIAGQAIDGFGSTPSASDPHPAPSTVLPSPECPIPAKEECGPSKPLDPSLASPLMPEHEAPVASTTVSIDVIAEEYIAHAQTRRPDVAKDGEKMMARDNAGNTILAGDRAPLAKAASNRQVPPRFPVRRMMSFNKCVKGDGASKGEAEHIPAVVSDEIDKAISTEREKEKSGAPPLASRKSSNLGCEIPLRRVAPMREDRADRGRAVESVPSKDRTTSTSREGGMSDTGKVSGALPARTSLTKAIRSLSFTKSSKRESWKREKSMSPPKKVSIAEKGKDVEPRASTFSRAASTSRKDGKDERRSKGPMRILSRMKSNVFSRASSMTAKETQTFQERQPTAHTEAIDAIPEDEFEMDDGPGTTFFPIDRNVVEVQRNSKKCGTEGGGLRRLLSRDKSKDRRSGAESGGKSGKRGKSKERD